MIRHSSHVAVSVRLLIGLIFLITGIGKIGAPAVTHAYIASAGLPFTLVGYLLAIAVEVGGAILLVVGFQSRIVAAVIAAFTMATGLSFHTDFADENQMIHSLKNVAMMGGVLQIVAFGAGAFGLDSRRERARDSACARPLPTRACLLEAHS